MFARGGAAQLGFLSGAFLGFFKPIAFAFEGDDLSAVQQPIDPCADATGVGKHLVPFAKYFVGGQENRPALFITAGHHFKQQVGVA